MLISAGLMLAAYALVRLYETSELAEQGNLCPQDGSRIEPSMESEVTKPWVLRAETEVENKEAYHSHFAQVAMISTALLWVGRAVPILRPLGFAGYFYSSIPYVRSVESSLREHQRVNVDVLFFVAHLLTLGLGQHVVAALAVSLVHSGKLSSERAKGDSRKLVASIFNQLPDDVWLLVDGSEVRVPLKDVEVGDIMVATAGTVIAVDGVVRDGHAIVDERTLTGESQPSEKGSGDRVFANTLVVGGRICIQVEKSGQETTAAKIADILLRATNSTSAFQLKGEEWADRATLPMLVVAAFVLRFLGPQSTVVFIHSHMGNRVRLFAPIATLQHLAAAARRGILVKDGRALERLCDVDTFLFDKTGTLTTNEMEVVKVASHGPWCDADVVRMAATAERKHTHPIATGILRHAESLGIAFADSNFPEVRLGFGVGTMMDGRHVRVGSARFMEVEGIRLASEDIEYADTIHRDGNTLVWIAVDESIAGSVELTSRVRPEAIEIIRGLRRRGVQHIAMVSGDHLGPAKKLADNLGLDEFFYEILPDQKAHIVERLQTKGRMVCFVGDGINDVLAMKQADVSVSLDGAASIATDVAEVILMDGSLAQLTELYDISRSLNDRLNTILKLTVAPGAINVAGALVLRYSILTSILVNLGFSIFAIWGSAIEPELDEGAIESA